MWKGEAGGEGERRGGGEGEHSDIKGTGMLVVSFRAIN